MSTKELMKDVILIARLNVCFSAPLWVIMGEENKLQFPFMHTTSLLAYQKLY